MLYIYKHISVQLLLPTGCCLSIWPPEGWLHHLKVPTVKIQRELCCRDFFFFFLVKQLRCYYFRPDLNEAYTLFFKRCELCLDQ